MIIQLWNFTKRHNSTARPEGSAYIEIDAYIKRPTTINTPTFIIDFNGEFPPYNYIVVPSLHMYYYINDIGFVNKNIFELMCSLDYLATARPYINSTSAFVKYSSSNYDPYIKDDRIAATAELESVVSNNNFSSLFNTHPEYTSSYSLLLTVLNGDNQNNSAGIRHYLINRNNLRYICEKIIQDGQSIIGGINQIFNDAKDSLIKLQLVPWSVSGLQTANIIGSNTTPIYLGGYDTGQEGYAMDANAVYSSDDFVDIPSRASDFTRVEPFCEGKIHIPLIGTFDLSLSELADTNRIYFRYFANIGSGKASCILWKGNADITNSAVKIIGAYDGNINADVPLGYATSQNPTGLLTGGVSLAAAALGSGALTLGGIAGAIASFASYFTKQASVVNAFGGNASAKDNLKLSVYLMKRALSEEPDNLRVLYGRPCGKVLSMSELTGYVETSQFQLMAPLDDDTVQAVNRLMDTGVYLE